MVLSILGSCFYLFLECNLEYPYKFLRIVFYTDVIKIEIGRIEYGTEYSRYKKSV